jgi:hypothetical protein
MTREDRLRETSPLWRSGFRAQSPDHAFVAEINPAWEISMGSPTHGTLCLSAGLHLERCSPVFLWSPDSRFLVVTQFVNTFWRGLRQQLLVIDVADRWIYRSAIMAPYLQPESFVDGSLTVIRNPHRRPSMLSWQIPNALSGHFSKKKGMWSCQINGQPSDPCAPPTGSAGV